ncbi:MAG TPA: NADH-quinone oxidoreductase subunit N [Fibrobacteria bacterium]|nr:NADH-quinone oxidoreductase subunit N [Fibrobacteria bacterium]
MNPYLLSQTPLVLGFMLLLVLAALRPGTKENLSTGVSILALGLSAVCIWVYLPLNAEYFGGAIRVTPVGKVLAYLCLGLTAAALILSEEYLDKVRVHAIDWRMVVLAIGLGMVNLCLAGDLATLFVAYELVSIPAYVLAGFSHRDPRSNEAGLKYLILGAFTSGLFLLGLSFLYGATGEIHLVAIQDKLAHAAQAGLEGDLVLARVALGLVLGAIFFKVAVAPFHQWLPDVYQGTNLASLAIISAPVKVAVFGMLGMLLWGPFEPLAGTWKPVLLGGAAFCAVLGNLQAIVQTNLKRLVAYSAVVNAGFILIGILVDSVPVVVFYLGAYGFMTLGSWAAFMAMSSRKADVDELSDLVGMGRRHRWLALGMTILLLSYAGIPLTAGFAAKFGVVLEAMRPEADLPPYTFWVVLLSVMAGLVSFYFYFQIMRALWLQQPAPDSAAALGAKAELRWNYIFVLALSVGVVLALGMFMKLPGL